MKELVTERFMLFGQEVIRTSRHGEERDGRPGSVHAQYPFPRRDEADPVLPQNEATHEKRACMVIIPRVDSYTDQSHSWSAGGELSTAF